MRVLFFISLLGHGRGGHVHSLYHISNEIACNHDVGIVSIGPGDMSTISKHPQYIAHLNFNGFDLLNLRHHINNIINDFDPDIFHFFDTNSYNIVTLLYPRKKLKTVVNKCGGPNHKRYPYVYDLVLFSMENKIWFENNKRYKDSNITLIPNRVTQISPTYLDVNKPKGYFSFVKIARIGTTYKDSIIDSINLIDTLYNINPALKIKLFVIGVVEDSEVLKEIASNKYVKDGTVILLTENKHTKEASKMLYLADAAIATGRGVMEAASLALPVLTIDSKSNTPVLLTDSTFDNAFKTNFSSRNTFPDLVPSDNLRNIEKLITDTTFYKHNSAYIRDIFDKHFNVQKASHKYEEVYKKAVGHKYPYFSLNPFYACRSIYHFYRNSTKNFKKKL